MTDKNMNTQTDTQQNTSPKKSFIQINKRTGIIAGIIAIMVTGIGVMGYLQFQRYQTQQAIIATNQAYVAYLEEATDLDEQIKEFDDLVVMEETPMKTIYRRYEDEAAVFQEEYTEYQTAASELQAQLEKQAGNESLAEYTTRMTELEQIQAEEYEVIDTFIENTQQYMAFFTSVEESFAELEKAMDDVESVDQVSDYFRDYKEVVEELHGQLNELEDLEYYGEFYTMFDKMFSEIGNFLDDIILAVENDDYAAFERAITNVEFDDSDFAGFDTYDFENLVDASEDRTKEINKAIDEVGELEEDLAAAYDLSYEEDDIAAFTYERETTEGLFSPGNDENGTVEQDDAFEAYTL